MMQGHGRDSKQVDAVLLEYSSHDRKCVDVCTSRAHRVLGHSVVQNLCLRAKTWAYIPILERDESPSPCRSRIILSHRLSPVREVGNLGFVKATLMRIIVYVLSCELPRM